LINITKKMLNNSKSKFTVFFPILLLSFIFLVVQCSPKRMAMEKEEEELFIQKISFIGAKSLKPKQLKKAMRIIGEGDIYDEYKVKVGLDNVLSYYKMKGFFDTKILARKGEFFPEKNAIDLYFTINEGKRAIIKSITFIGNKTITNKKLLKTIIVKTREPYDYLKVFTSRYNLTAMYAQKGYIYAEVTTSSEGSFLIDNNLTFTIEEGKKVFVKDIKIVGNKSVRSKIIEREILLKPGDVYSPGKVYSSQQKIYATGLFDDVKSEIEGIKEKKEQVTVVFKVIEGKTKWVVLAPAFQTPDRITMNAGWGNDNLLNNNQSININYTYTFNFRREEWGNLNINYTEPYLFSTPLRFSLYLYNEREVTTRTQDAKASQYFGNIYGINSRVGYSVNLSTDITVELKFKKAFINIMGDYKPEKNILTNSVLFAYSRDRRDNIFNPHQGLLSLTSTEFAGNLLKGDNHFIRYIEDFSIYRRVTKRSVLASNLRIGYTVPLRSNTGTSISVDERFELGGASSLRGYSESSIGTLDIRGKYSGIYLINGGEEFRFPIYKLLSGAVFADWGGLWLNREDMNLKSTKLGIGFGIRYNTVIGPVRIDYGYRLTDRTKNYKGNVYFAIGNAY